MQGKLSGLGTGAGISGVAIAAVWIAKIFLPVEMGHLTPEEAPAAREAIASFIGFVLASAFGMGWGWLRSRVPDEYDPPPLQSHWSVSLVLLLGLVLLQVGCAFQGYPPRAILGDASFCSGEQVERVLGDGTWERTCKGESMNGAQLSDAAAGVIEGAAGAARTAAGAVIGGP